MPRDKWKLTVDTTCWDYKEKKMIYCGKKNEKSTARPRTFTVGKQYFLTNWAYEMEEATNVQLEFKNTIPYEITIEGLWSSDSVGWYTVLS